MNKSVVGNFVKFEGEKMLATTTKPITRHKEPHMSTIKENSPAHVLSTKDYDKFKTIPGNRQIDERHVQQLIRSFEDRGNLTNEFPIVVNENMEVIDGQHRIAALKELGWEVGYRIEEGLTINTVRDINYAAKNWTWRDYASSYAALGNVNYQRFLKLSDKFGVGFHTVCRYLGIAAHQADTNSSFKNGDMEVSAEAVAHADQQLQQLSEASDAAQRGGNTFSTAMYYLMQSPDYDHTRMVHKLGASSTQLKDYSGLTDYMRAIEDIYNYRVALGTDKVRLF